MANYNFSLIQQQLIRRVAIEKLLKWFEKVKKESKDNCFYFEITLVCFNVYLLLQWKFTLQIIYFFNNPSIGWFAEL